MRRALVLAALLTVAACKSNVVGPTDSGTPVTPPTDVSFSASVFPILSSRCGGGCHSPSSESGVNVSSYSKLMASTGQRYRSKVVLPGDGANSPLVDKLSSRPKYGSRMPEGGALTATQIATIKAWIDEGALDN